jgi:hypothetical protein
MQAYAYEPRTTLRAVWDLILESPLYSQATQKTAGKKFEAELGHFFHSALK